MKNKQVFLGRIILFLMIITSLPVQTQAFLWWSKEEPTDTVVQVEVGNSIAFGEEIFQDKKKLASITLHTLPKDYFGWLLLDGIPLQSQEEISASSLGKITFLSKSTLGNTEFIYIPNYLDGSTGEQVCVTIEVTDRPNTPPVACDMELFTYKNIEINCYFDVSDQENDFLTFQIVNPPARGSVTIDEHGSSSFLYKPYENKVGKDEFSYVVTDSYGNVSNEAVIKLKIEKADTPVAFYGDMEGHSAHKSAISLAEAGVFVGECVGNTYLFHPEKEVTREEFLSLAMAVTNLEPLSEVTVTGFYDDEAIDTWYKGYVSSALMVGAIQGSWDSEGRPVFQGDSVVTMGEATVILEQLLRISAESEVSGEHWASQASANLSAVGVSSEMVAPLPASLNRGEVAELLDSALALWKTKEDKWMTW